MKHIFTISVFAAALGLVSPAANAQQRTAKRFGRPVEYSKCGTTEYEALLKRKNSQRATTAQFEEWMSEKVVHARAQNLFNSLFTTTDAFSTNAVVTIPVVIHVIHNGDAVGSNENIADGQILSQIEVLNQDFRREFNSPGHNTNLVGADAEIEFCLAKRDPAGLYTTGINRYDMGSEEGWDIFDVEVLKTQTQWDPAKYLNIWIVNEMFIDGSFGVAGYAQFPQQSGLPGLDGGSISEEASTDGVVIAANCFGSSDIYEQGYYNPGQDKGRTATHEIGHFLGLRHIWGDEGNCTGDDFCDDTPVAAGPNNGCPEPGFDSCPDNDGFDMVQNYMDYTEDVCHNIFTLNQKERMMAVLANSPRRASLTTSDGCVPGEVLDLDGSLNIQGINPECGTVITPGLIFGNSGNVTLTSAAISYRLDNETSVIYNWTGSLAAGQQTTISLPEVTVAYGDHTFTVAITALNGSEDQAPANDNKSQAFTIVSAYNTTDVTFTILTDNYGFETIWLLGDIDAELPIGGNIDFETGTPEIYGNNELHTVTMPVSNGQCYTLVIIDAAADGICCGGGNGYYRLETADGTVIAEGGEFGQQIMHEFRIDTSLGMGDVAKGLNSIRLYPNPANSVLNIALPEATALPDGYTVYNSLGQVMDSGKFTSALQALDIAQYANGVYFVKVASGDNSKTIQFIKY
ncbi:M43 family zinc metalloprotease [uncultured Flavobacterium sp.]|uniref:M43 family zinc metalloprotease n=1 Tax=uncultured Flavobacterium sp. TaxID=165435 RepID=UPI00260017EB|nr:M43 family zinc metalloprotease [uncultured Flavobacterium sp.]